MERWKMCFVDSYNCGEGLGISYIDVDIQGVNGPRLDTHNFSQGQCQLLSAYSDLLCDLGRQVWQIVQRRQVPDDGVTHIELLFKRRVA